MAAINRDDGEEPDSLLSILSLNLFKLLDLSGAPALLWENRPHFAFCQELSPSAHLAASTGYRSSSAQPHCTMVVLSHVSDVDVTDVEPGYVQLITWRDISFLHLHIPLWWW
jgi:hypothetical protein